MFRIHQIAFVTMLLATKCVAQDTSTSDQESIRLLVQQVKQLQEQDRDLSERIRALEGNPAPAAQQGDAGVAAVPAPAPPAQENASSEPMAPAMPDMHELHGIQWRGFGEVNYKVLDQRKPELSTHGFTPGSAGNFYTGDFSLLLTSRINDKAGVLSEIVFGEQEEQRFTVELQRLLLKYDYSDHLRMSVGRYQTGIGYYNTHYHSGDWFLTTADRPLIVEDSTAGGPLPVRAVGVSVTGLIPSGKLGLNYIWEYGSSDTNRAHLDGSSAGDDESNGNHLNVSLFARPEAIPGLQIGGSFYHDKISNTDPTTITRNFGQTIVNAHVVYVGHGIEFLNEGFLIRHSVVHSSTVFNMPAFYSQLSKRFVKSSPFFLYQYVNFNRSSIFEDVALRYGPSFGARYDFNEDIAGKVQLDHIIRKGQPDLNGLQLQLVFTF